MNGELGAASPAEHQAILEKAADCNFDTLVLVGSEFGRTNFTEKKALHFPNALAARDWWQTQNFSDTLLLLKGSRGIRLETIIES